MIESKLESLSLISIVLHPISFKSALLSDLAAAHIKETVKPFSMNSWINRIILPPAAVEVGSGQTNPIKTAFFI